MINKTQNSSTATVNSSSTASTPSSSSSSSTRPQCYPRQHSDTHIFPARPSSSTTKPQRKGLSSATAALAKEALGQQAPQPGATNDKAFLFFGGLQWLLDSTVEPSKPVQFKRDPRKSSLTDDAVNAFAQLDCEKRRIVELEEGSENGDVEAKRTEAWVSDQLGSVKAPA